MLSSTVNFWIISGWQLLTSSWQPLLFTIYAARLDLLTRTIPIKTGLSMFCVCTCMHIHVYVLTYTSSGEENK